jgi:hypothetical protein
MTAEEVGAAKQAVKSARGAFWLSEKLKALAPRAAMVAGCSMDMASPDGVIQTQCYTNGSVG